MNAQHAVTAERELSQLDQTKPTKRALFDAKRNRTRDAFKRIPALTSTQRLVFEASMRAAFVGKVQDPDRPWMPKVSALLTSPTRKTVERLMGKVADSTLKDARRDLVARGFLTELPHKNGRRKTYQIEVDAINEAAGYGGADRAHRRGWFDAYDAAEGHGIELTRTNNRIEKAVLEAARDGSPVRYVDLTYRLLSRTTKPSDRVVGSGCHVDRVLFEAMKWNRNRGNRLDAELGPELKQRLALWKGRSREAARGLLKAGKIIEVDRKTGRGGWVQYELTAVAKPKKTEASSASGSKPIKVGKRWENPPVGRPVYIFPIAESSVAFISEPEIPPISDNIHHPNCGCAQCRGPSPSQEVKSVEFMARIVTQFNQSSPAVGNHLQQGAEP